VAAVIDIAAAMYNCDGMDVEGGKMLGWIMCEGCILRRAMTDGIAHPLPATHA